MGPNVPLPANKYSRAQRLTSTNSPTAPPHLEWKMSSQSLAERLLNLLHSMYVAFS
jgi:hypothetical protein